MKKYLEKSCVLTAALVAIFLTAPVAAAPNGMVVNAGTGSVTVFDDATGVVQGSLLIGSGSMGDCSITGDGSTGFATRFNNQVTVIDLTGGAPVLAGPPNPIPISNFGEDTSISPDGQFLVVCDGGNVQQYLRSWH
jgi:DNA-binding beta-propeller fold protein YncE